MLPQEAAEDKPFKARTMNLGCRSLSVLEGLRLERFGG